MEELGETSGNCPLRFTITALLIAAAIFAGVAPTLSWLEFSSGSENLVAGTVLEMRRGGPWLVPQLNGMPRTSKPPLVAWISAGLVNQQTVASLSDPSKRDQAYRELSWEIRWPALLFACLALIAGAWMGRVLIGGDAGLVTAAIMGSTVMFLRFGRSATTDVQLMLWVTIANVFFAIAILQGRRWLGCIMGGVALGLALMSKGPPALAQTAAPIAVMIAWRWWKKRSDTTPLGWRPSIVAALVALAVALPWPIVVLSRMSGQLAFWYHEMTQGGTLDYYESDPWWSYIAIVPLILPWIAFFVLGLVLLIREKSDRAVLTLSFLLTPIVVMSCFREKNDRYLLPMLAPAAVICAVAFVRRGKELDSARRVVTTITWIMLAVIGIGLAIMGAFSPRLGGGRWWSMSAAAAMAAGCGAVIAMAWWLERRGMKTLLPAAVIVMLWSQALFTYGYKDSDRGRSDGRPVADVICATLPADAEVWSYTVPGRFSRVPIDTLIYLNRTTRPAAIPTTLPANGRTQAILVHFRGAEKLPEGMESWRLLGSTDKNQGTWRAYVRGE